MSATFAKSPELRFLFSLMEMSGTLTLKELTRRLPSKDYMDWVHFKNWEAKERERQRQIAQSRRH